MKYAALRSNAPFTADPRPAALASRELSHLFHGASIRRKDLALYTGLFAGDAVPAPGRQLRDWEHEAVDQMAAHLVTLGFEVLDERPAVEEVPNDWGDPTLGGVRVRRYGWEATGVVRIDSTGEVFIRLDPDAVAGPVLRPVPD